MFTPTEEIKELMEQFMKNYNENDKFIRHYEQLSQHVPIDIKVLANCMNLKVTEKDMQTLSGKVFKDDYGYHIEVNEKDPAVRKRFTIAHELAHFILHKNDINNDITDNAMYRGKLTSKKETEANKFAAYLLMPWYAINNEIDKYNRKYNTKPTAEELAKIFHVSHVAMAIRLGLPT